LHYSSRDVGKLTQMYASLVERGGTEALGRRPSITNGKTVGGEYKASLSWLAEFMDRCGKADYDNKPMPENSLISLLRQTGEILRKLPNVVNIDLKGDVRLIVVGDLHGQVEDLLHILKTHGLPNKNKWFLFNGDFVDRGNHAIEITIILFTLKMLFGDWVFMNRGNHEADDINARDGFQDECVEKYSLEVYNEFNKTFTTLPIVHIVNSKALIVHGGLCWEAGVTIETIQKIDRFCLHPEWESVMEDLLWSDPGGPKHNGASQNDRGCGCIFGEDIVEEFFEDNPPLNFVIRSHEKKEAGYEVHFHGKLITVFSASNYCGDNGNDGAVLELMPSLEYKIHTFYATPPGDGDEKFSDRYSTLAASVTAKLIHRIAENRLQLLEYYSQCNKELQQKVTKHESKKEFKNDEAIITRVEWARGLREVLKLNIKFLHIQTMLGVPLLGVGGKKKGKFNYVDWLGKFAPTNTVLKLKKSAGEEIVKVKETLNKITQVLLKHRVAVKSMFRYFDANGDGEISLQELTNGLVILGKVYNETFKEEEVKELVNYLDKDGNKGIDYSEFLAHFSVSSPELTKALSRVPSKDLMRGCSLQDLGMLSSRRQHRTRRDSVVKGGINVDI